MHFLFWGMTFLFVVLGRGVKLTHKNVMSNIVQMKALDTTFTTDTGTTTATNVCHAISLPHHTTPHHTTS